MSACKDCGGVVVCAPRCGGPYAKERRHFGGIVSAQDARADKGQALLALMRAQPHLTCRELAAATGAHAGQVYQVARTHKIRLPFPKWRKLSREQVAAIAARIGAGEHVQHIAEELGMSKTTVRACWEGPLPKAPRAPEAAAPPRPRTRLRPEVWPGIFQRLAKGASCRALAEEFGVSRTTIWEQHARHRRAQQQDGRAA